MDANKLDSEKCIKIAQDALRNGDFQKALKFLEKSEKLYPTEIAKGRSLL
jgi:hypothetical protein